MTDASIGIILVVVVFAVALGYLINRVRIARELGFLQLQNEQQKQQLSDLGEELSEKRNALEKGEAELHRVQTDLAVVTQELEGVRKRKTELEGELNTEREKITTVEGERNTINEKYATLKASLTEKEKHFAEQLQKLDEQKSILKKEFENLANQIFEAKGKTFSDQSKASLDAMLNPFKQQINDFKGKVETLHLEGAKQQAEMRAELKQLQGMHQKMTQEAHNLATALEGQKKVQGNWGELVLENVLDQSGLQLGKDYKREVSLSNDEGGRSRPDVVVYLPQGKHLIIDAKVSLNAYTRYINSESEADRKKALKEHVTVIADRIKELSNRDYYKLAGINSPEMVFMFVPIESAFVEALKADESLFQKAIQQNVLVATPTTLLTSLNIVRQLWRFEDQNKHTAELAKKAEGVFRKLRTFLSSFEGVKKGLDKAQDSYAKAEGQLVSGPGNLVKQVNEFKQLAPAIRDQLPEHFMDKASLELNQLPATYDVKEGAGIDSETDETD